MVIVDAANVVGSRPTGWWRDRPRAAGELVQRIRAATAAERLPTPIVVVLEGLARAGNAEVVVDGVQVLHAPRSGDDTLAALVAAASGSVLVVSADRALGRRARAFGADVVGPLWLLDLLDTPPGEDSMRQGD